MAVSFPEHGRGAAPSNLKGSAMEKSMDLLAFGPSDEVRRFVIAAAAAGLPSEIICLMLPRLEGQAPLDPRQLDKALARAGGPLLGVRLNIARVLNRGLSDGEGSEAAQMAVFKA